MRKLMIMPVLALSLAAAPALASEENEHAAVPQAGWLTVEQITQKLTDAGYDVRDIETNENGYEVYAIDSHGRRLEAVVDPMTGEVIGEAEDD